MSRDALYFALAINGQKPDLIILLFEVINHTHAAAFPFSSHCPADFANTARAANNLARFWILKQKTLQPQIFVIRQIIINVFGKGDGFDEFHKLIIRLCRILCKPCKKPPSSFPQGAVRRTQRFGLWTQVGVRICTRGDGDGGHWGYYSPMLNSKAVFLPKDFIHRAQKRLGLRQNLLLASERNATLMHEDCHCP